MTKCEKCPNVEVNSQSCRCTYTGCERRGKCCECISYHWKRGELSGCLFPTQIEKTYDRTIKKFVETYQE